MQTFEVVGSGFAGGTDKTDDRVFWVNAPSPEVLKAAIEGLDADFFGQIGCDASDGAVDFVLPRDAEALQERLREIFVRTFVPSGEYEFGSYRPLASEPYQRVTVLASSQWQARSVFWNQLSDADRHYRFELIEARPNPRHMAQQMQARIWGDAQSAKRTAAVLEERANAPLYAVRLAMEVRDGSAIARIGDWIDWTRACLNCNANNILAHVEPADVSLDDRTQGSKVEIDVNIRIKRKDGLPTMAEADVMRWASACLNCNTNHIVAEVSLAEPVVEVGRMGERGG